MVRSCMFAAAIAGALLAVGPRPALAQSRVPVFARIFGDHAVLQRDRPIAVRGRAAPGAVVRVTLDGASASATTDPSGAWRTTLPARPAGGPYTLTAAVGAARTSLADVMVGDVYLCGGQSNMEFPARLSTGAWSGLAPKVDPQLRFVTIAKHSEPAPLADLAEPAPWKVVGPDTVGDASAVCFYMARALQKAEGVPVGFVASDWGGTTIQGWISAAALRTMPAYADGVASVVRLGTDPVHAMALEERRQEDWWAAHVPQAVAQRAWIAPGYDDSAWPTLVPAGSWKEAGIAALSAFDGVAWFRTEVTLTAEQAAGAERLLLGPVDTFDTAWVNGRRVGSGSTAWLWRDYRVPSGVLHAGRNVVVLRVLGGGTGGGLTGQPGDRAVVTGTGERIALPPAWRYRIGPRVTGLSAPAAPWDVPNSLTTLYNGMIAPIADYGYKLAAWYQGESNAGAPDDYATLLPLLMADWRRATHDPDLPFLVVQLAAYGPPPVAPGESGWARLRDIQAKAVHADRHAGLAVAVDVGDRYDIHPSEKRIVGERLARAARAVAYGEAIVPGGPSAIAASRVGGDVVVRFRDAPGGLRAYGAEGAIGFEACTAQRCRYVRGEIAGETVVLRGAGDAAVTRIRYAWADAPLVNLFSADDLPAVPFEAPVR